MFATRRKWVRTVDSPSRLPWFFPETITASPGSLRCIEFGHAAKTAAFDAGKIGKFQKEMRKIAAARQER